MPVDYEKAAVVPEAVTFGTGAGGSRSYARKKDTESVKYATKTFTGTRSMQSQSNG